MIPAQTVLPESPGFGTGQSGATGPGRLRPTGAGTERPTGAGTGQSERGGGRDASAGSVSAEIFQACRMVAPAVDDDRLAGDAGGEI